jgi:hypothetical protein
MDLLQRHTVTKPDRKQARWIQLRLSEQILYEDAWMRLDGDKNSKL